MMVALFELGVNQKFKSCGDYIESKKLYSSSRYKYRCER